MSERPLIKQYGSIVNGNMSGNIVGLPSIILRIPMFSYAFTWSGTSPVGTVSIQVSNDYAENAVGGVLNAGIWNTIPVVYNGSSVTAVPLSGNTGNGFIDVDSLGGYAVRPIYTFTSGTGTLQALLEAKVT
jgi:hypothetical protein